MNIKLGYFDIEIAQETVEESSLRKARVMQQIELTKPQEALIIGIKLYSSKYQLI